MERRIILVAHGHLAQEMFHSMELIAGAHPEVSYVNLEPHNGAVDVREKLLKQIESDAKTLIIADIVGGTPCNEAFKIAIEKENVYVLSGMSLAMTLQAVLSFEEDDEKWLEEIAEAGHNSIKNVIQSFAADDDEEE